MSQLQIWGCRSVARTNFRGSRSVLVETRAHRKLFHQVYFYLFHERIVDEEISSVFIHFLLASQRHVDSSLWRRTWCSPSRLSCVRAGIPGYLRITLAFTSRIAACSRNPSLLCLFDTAKYGTLGIVRQQFVYEELACAGGLTLKSPN